VRVVQCEPTKVKFKPRRSGMADGFYARNDNVKSHRVTALGSLVGRLLLGGCW
jgi:hypothetical protein